MNARAAAFAALVCAAGCATAPPAGDGANWPARRAELQALDRWALQGRVAVAAGGEGFSGGLTWQQQGTRADVALRGPIGGAAYTIRVDGDGFSVTDRQGETFEGDEARALLAARLGAELPVAELRYWLTGAPAPQAPGEETLGPDARLAGLEQSGWNVRYAGYRAAGELMLPARLELTAAGIRLRIAVSDWQLGP